jgi:predicted MFS family arabinose efflux permease
MTDPTFMSVYGAICAVCGFIIGVLTEKAVRRRARP